MAEPYLKRLSQIVDRFDRSGTSELVLETRHFFSGAALYANGKICGLFSPTGLALKLPADLRHSMINEKKGEEFRFFAAGPIKREYVLLSESIIADEKVLQALMRTSIDYVTSLPS